jgi:hypothetical protein
MTGTVLSEPLAALLRAGMPALVLSVGADGWGHAAMTWAVAPAARPAGGRDAAGGPAPDGAAGHHEIKAPDVVRFIVDHGSTTQTNLQRDGRASIQIVGPNDLVALIKGPARERRVRVEAAPFAMAMWEMTVTGVKDQSWGPVAVSPLTYEWRGPEAEALRRIAQAVLAELRDWPGA